jgi:hypothetical protein
MGADAHLDNLLLGRLALGAVLFLAYLGEEHRYLGINQRGDAVWVGEWRRCWCGRGLR